MIESSHEQKLTPAEIVRELDKVLASKVFAKALKQALVLRFIVNSAITHLQKGLPLTSFEMPQHVIGEEFYKPYDPDATNVRTTLNFVRKRINEYYEGEGRNDFVRIDIPPGRYIPTFTVNAASPHEIDYRYALSLASADFPENVVSALNILKKVVRDSPPFARAHAKMAELYLNWSFCNVSYATPADRSLARTPQRWILARAQDHIEKALAADPDLWLIHAAQGMVHCRLYQWGLAGEAFNRAKALSPNDLFQHWWYAAYLLAIGNQNEALGLVRAHAQTVTNDPAPQLFHALFLYVVRQYDAAYALLSPSRRAPGDTTPWYLATPTEPDPVKRPSSWLAKVLEACIRLATGEFDVADLLIPVLQSDWPASYSEDSISATISSRYLGLFLLAMSADRSHPETISMGFNMEQERTFFNLINWLHNHPATPYEYKPSEFEYDTTRDPIQLALACMVTATMPDPSRGEGQFYNAIQHLRHAIEGNHPLTGWLHLWPIFDPLRYGHRHKDEFAELIALLNLPQQV